MDHTKLQPVIFEDEYYTLPDAIKQICTAFKIPFLTIKQKNEDGVIVYKTIYQHLLRELNSRQLKPDDIKKEEGKRKTQFSRAILNDVVNGKLYPWLCKKARLINHNQFLQWEEKRKKYSQIYADYLAKVQGEGFAYSEVDRNLDVFVRRSKLEIALEYIFNKFLELDEELLRQDHAITLFADDSDPSPVEEAAMERLRTYKNYYKEKESIVNATDKCTCKLKSADKKSIGK